MTRAWARPLTATGLVLHGSPPQLLGPEALPYPRFPYRLFPQAITVPFASSAKPSLRPDVTAVTPLSALTSTGTLLSVVAPSPSCPMLLEPQAITVPLLNR